VALYRNAIAKETLSILSLAAQFFFLQAPGMPVATPHLQTIISPAILLRLLGFVEALVLFKEKGVGSHAFFSRMVGAVGDIPAGNAASKFVKINTGRNRRGLE